MRSIRVKKELDDDEDEIELTIMNDVGCDEEQVLSVTITKDAARNLAAALIVATKSHVITTFVDADDR